MPTGIFDIRDRAPVLHPHEIAAGEAECRARGLEYIAPADASGRVSRLADMVAALHARWARAVQTGKLMDHVRSGYCSIDPIGSAEPSTAVH